MGKITDALKRAAEERIFKFDRSNSQNSVKYEFIASKTADSPVDPRIVAFYDIHSPVSEQYRTLRTNIQGLNSAKPIKTIAITSSIHNEGKTITATNLAIALARDSDKKKVLLVDADLRRPKVSKYLGINSDSGLAGVISEGADIRDVLFDVGVENLDVLPAGKYSGNPAELFGSNKMTNLISLLKSKYDHVIFDTPPIIPVTDAGLIGAQTDGVIMVIKSAHTQRGMISHSETLLKQAQAKLLGYVLTNIQYHIPAYIYRYL